MKAPLEIRVVENTDKSRYLSLAAKTELNDAHLTAVAGGTEQGIATFLRTLKELRSIGIAGRGM